MKTFIFIIMLLISVTLCNGYNPDTSSAKLVSHIWKVFPFAYPEDTIHLYKIESNDGNVYYRSNFENIKSLTDFYLVSELDNRIYREKNVVIEKSLYALIPEDPQRGGEKISVTMQMVDSTVIDRFIADNGISEVIDRKGSSFSLDLTIFELSKFAQHSDITKITRKIEKLYGGDENVGDVDYYDFYTPPRFIESNFMFPKGITNMPSYGLGTGVKSSTLEEGITDGFREFLRHEIETVYGLDTTEGEIDGRTDKEAKENSTPDHSHMCWYGACMAAPGAILNHSKLDDYSKARNWLIDNRIETTSLSYDEETGGATHEKFAYEDFRPLICNSIGNDGVWYYNAYKTYHKEAHYDISIGGSIHTNFDYFEITEHNIWAKLGEGKGDQPGDETTNVSARTLTRTLNGRGSDRELPNIVATSTAAGKFGDLKTGSKVDEEPFFEGLGGTSIAAPIVNGIGAAVIGANEDGIFSNFPERTKMALLLTAVNIDGGYWNHKKDGLDGAGQVCGYDAVEYANKVVDVTQDPSNSAEKGIAYGELATDGTAKGESFLVKIPDNLPNDKHLKVVLTWTACVYSNNGSSGSNDWALADLNLFFYADDGTRLSSRSIDDNIEIVDIPTHLLTPGSECEVKFEIAEMPVHSTGTWENPEIRYALGWTFVRDFAGKTITHDDLHNNGIFDETLTRTKLIKGTLERPLEISNGTTNKISIGHMSTLRNTHVTSNTKLHIVPKVCVFNLKGDSENFYNSKGVIQYRFKDYSRYNHMIYNLSTTYDEIDTCRFSRWKILSDGTYVLRNSNKGYKLLGGDGSKKVHMINKMGKKTLSELSFSFFLGINYSEFNNGKRFVGNIYKSSNEAVIVNFDNDEITLTIRDVDGEVYHVSKKITVNDFYNVKILNEGPTPTSHKTDRGLCHIGLVFDADERMAIVINGSECATININASDVDFSFKEHQLYRDVETVDVPLLLEDVMLFSGVLTVGQINSFMRFSNWPYHGSTFTD